MKEKILKLIELKCEIKILEASDTEKQSILDSGSYALAEGYTTPNMNRIKDLESEIDSIEL